MNLAELRENYTQGGIRVAEMNLDPFVQFEQWVQAAAESGIPEPNAMVLATSSSKGRLSTRTVLLKGMAQQGFQFFTNYQSRKARDLAANPNASVTFLWKELERQINIQGVVDKTSREVSEEYFRTRPWHSQIGAWVSERQSETIPVRAVLEEREEKLMQQFPEGTEVPCPEFWGGYHLTPTHIEFWQGRQGRIHDRIRYRKSENDAWLIERLSP